MDGGSEGRGGKGISIFFPGGGGHLTERYDYNAAEWETSPLLVQPHSHYEYL